MIEQATITCPKCGHQAVERMRKDACLFFYDCKGCGERLKPQPGDCFVHIIGQRVTRPVKRDERDENGFIQAHSACVIAQSKTPIGPRAG
jgi:hypothetical protein